MTITSSSALPPPSGAASPVPAKAQTEILMEKRERIKIQRVEGVRNRPAADSVFRRALQRRYTSVLVRLSQVSVLASLIPSRMQLVVHIETAEEAEEVMTGPALASMRTGPGRLCAR